MEKCSCKKCDCPNKIGHFGHRFEEENAIVEAEFNKDVDKVESIISEVCKECVRGQHPGNPIE